MNSINVILCPNEQAAIEEVAAFKARNGIAEKSFVLSKDGRFQFPPNPTVCDVMVRNSIKTGVQTAIPDDGFWIVIGIK